MKQIVKWPFWGYAIFWSWNIIFLLFFTLGFTPIVLVSLAQAVREGWVQTSLLIFGGLIVLIPIISVALGLTVLFKQPNRLLALFYGVEGPLLLVLCVRFFVVGEATPPVTIIMVVAFAGMAALLWRLLDRRNDERGLLVTALRAIGLTGLLLAGIYAAIWLAFYVLPLAVQMVNAFVSAIRSIPDMIRFGRIQDLAFLPFSIFGFMLLMYSGTLLLVAPVVTPAIYAVHWLDEVRALWMRFSRPLAVALPATTVMACAAAFVVANQQPQQRAFALLASPPKLHAEAEALLNQQEAIRAGLLNAYLAPYRYMSAAGETFYIYNMYRSLGLSEAEAETITRWYEFIAQPLIYQPTQAYPRDDAQRWRSQAFVNDSQRAAELYEQFFDRPINQAERETIVSTVRSTWMVDRATQAWQAVDDREVRILRQELTITEHGDWADVELYETYQNLMPQQEEVVYYFSLPESAVLTGVWLGNSPDRSQRFDFRVAPRGAAQEVYRGEVLIRQEDPALLEQIGPRQYRLRVFPIEPKRILWDATTRRSQVQDGAQMHLWLTWRVMAGDAGWAMPRLAEKRNAFWDEGTVRLVNGAPMQAKADEWLPAFIPAQSKAERRAHRVTFDDGTVVVVRPADDAPAKLPGGFRAAIVLDRSRSMATHASAVQAALAQLKAALGDADAYLTAPPNYGEAPSVSTLAALDASALFYFGGQNPAELLAQFDQLRAGRQYDAVIVLTDGTAYAKQTQTTQAPTLDAPVWMVHLDGDLTLGYDDATLEAIQSSGGGVAEGVEEALTRIALQAQAGQTAGRVDVLDGYEWIVAPASALPEGGEMIHAPDDPFATLAARQLILSEMRQQRGRLGDLSVLDALHRIATDRAIVTPYSSMIVLVNAAQAQRLDELSQHADRFEREQENIGETQPLVTAVPEPHEWLLIGLAALMLAGYVLRRRMRFAMR
ncbi:MAG: TIGR02921 family PEP-CTERM protein [Candidatus Brachytrichaceae bacterium NZ_4S206]|jgi:putative PEP-CTERM system integral membrane protein